jgi:radical SAM-linked protein
METTAYRYRLTFCKEESVRFTSHLDLHRAWERTFRRAGLPLAYRQGYNPRPRINIGSALPLGYTSSAELLDFWLEEEVDTNTIARALTRAQAPGLPVRELRRVETKQPALQTQIRFAGYFVRLDDPPPGLKIQKAADTLMEADSLPCERRGKSYDLRPLIETLLVKQDGEDGDAIQLEMTLSAREGATGRPGEVLRAMDLDPTCAYIQRTKLIIAQLEEN